MGPIRKVLLPLCLLALMLPALHAQTPSDVGQWSGVMTWPQSALGRVPTHGLMLPSGKVAFWGSYADGLITRVWDPATNTVSTMAAPGYNVFCMGHTHLADGRIFTAGGHIDDYDGYPHASIYNPATNAWTQVPDMNAGRWYPTTTTLSNGDVLTISGTIHGPSSNQVYNEVPQVYQVGSNSWRTLSSATFHTQMYPFMFLAPNGKVFLAGWNPDTHYLDTTNTGAWSSTVSVSLHGWRNYGTAVMYDAGKILLIGGDGDSSTRTPTNTVEKIDLNAATPAWSYVAAMAHARRQLNATLLPDGTVLVTGGTSVSGFDSPTGAVYAAELYNPATNTWKTMASMAKYRGYHSFAMLLPDGRVLSAGGQTQANGTAGDSTAEIYSPPYLFNGTRPAITSAPASVSYGQVSLIGTSNTIARATWIRLSAVTHAFNQEQRFLNLTFAATTGGVNVTFPSSANLSPPGYYMLFLLNSAGVPSVARVIRIGASSGTGSGTIAGKVTDASTGAGLSGASVSVSNGGSTTTDSAGNYTVGNVPAGSQQVTASRTGYLSRTVSATVNAGATTTTNIAIATAGKIAGTVKTSSGTAISGANVQITGGSVSTTVNLTSSSTGTFTSDWIPVGNYTVTVSKSGYQTQAKTTTVTAGVTSNLAFTMTASTTTTGTIAGKVTNASNGAAIAGATVSVPNLAAATTDTSGNYSLHNVPTGSQTVTATKSGWGSRSVTVTVNSGATTTANIQLSTSGKITGTVKNGSGTAIGGATVKISGGVIATTVTLTTSSTGTYTSPWIPVGNYTVTVSKTGLTTQQKPATVNTGATTTVNFTM